MGMSELINSSKNDFSEQLQSTMLKASIIRRILRSAGLTYVRPTIDPHIPEGVVYQNADEFFETKSEDTQKILESLVAMGVYNKLLLDVIKTCPYCGSPLIDVEEVCPRCGSREISKINGVLRCESCSSTITSSTIMLVCKRCGRSFDASQVRARPLYSYLITEERDVIEYSTHEIELSGRLRLSDTLTKDLKATLERFLEKMEEVLNNYARRIYQQEPISPYVERGAEKPIQRSLPTHLDKTYQALRILGKATALQIADQTKRTRAIESVYLNQLVNLGLVEKERIGRKCYYFIKQ
jgi:predicted amidophosphoribosyltransferase